MHPPHVRAKALALIEEGLNDCEVSRRIGVSRRTILDWRRPTYVPREPAIPRGVPALLASRKADAIHAGGLRRVAWFLPRRRVDLRPATNPTSEDRARYQVSGHHRVVHSWVHLDRCCAIINRTDVHRARPYEYLSYDFANLSKDIVDLLVAACDEVGVFTRVSGGRVRRWSVRINRRESVALMLEHVGLKQ